MVRFAYSLLLIPFFAIAEPRDALAQDQSDWQALQTQDLRLANVADRIMIANARLCREQMPITGMILHSADQYYSAVNDARFANGPLAIAAVLPDSPAFEAGLRAGDTLLAINETLIADIPAPEVGNLREAGFDLLADQEPLSTLHLRVSRGESSAQEIVIQPQAGCRSLAEITIGEGSRARSDGRVIQIRYDFAVQMTDDELAAIFAHELAHTILEHRRRKEAAGISVGMLGELGRNQRANREAEVEADRLSVHLLANAGYDPVIAPALWRTGMGREFSGGLMGSWIYPSTGARAELIEREITMFLPNRRGPSWPGHLLALRDRSFSRD